MLVELREWASPHAPNIQSAEFRTKFRKEIQDTWISSWHSVGLDRSTVE